MKKKNTKDCYNCGGPVMEMGGNPPGMYWNGKEYVRTKGHTYENGTFFQQGGPMYYPPKQYPGYYKPYGYIEDGGNMGELRMGGYIPASINVQPQVLKRTDGTYHMQQGGAVYNDVYTAQPGPPIREQGGYWHPYPLIADGGHIAEIEYGGPISTNGSEMYDKDDPTPEYGKGGNWIKGAVNPAHKGYCTPMTKSTCTPRRKAFAKTMKAHHGFHEYGGPANPFHPLAYADGGMTDDPLANLGNSNPWAPTVSGQPTPQMPVQSNPDPNMAMRNDKYTNTDPNRQPLSPQYATNDQMVDASSFNDPYNQPMAPDAPQQRGPNGWQKGAMYGQGFNNLLGAGLMTAANVTNRKNEKNNAAYNRSLGMSDKMGTFQSPGGKGDYSQQGAFRPSQQVPSNAGYYSPNRQYGGGAQQYEHGGTYTVSDKEAKRLEKLGYKLQYM